MKRLGQMIVGRSLRERRLAGSSFSLRYCKAVRQKSGIFDDTRSALCRSCCPCRRCSGAVRDPLVGREFDAVGAPSRRAQCRTARVGSLRCNGIRRSRWRRLPMGRRLPRSAGSSTRPRHPAPAARESVDGQPRRLQPRADGRQLGRERGYFQPGTFPYVSRTGNWVDVSHYTQMIWSSTTRVGCAVHRSARMDYLICRYSPPGNIDGRSSADRSLIGVRVRRICR